MDSTINGRTPEEIKKGLECCTPRYESKHWVTCNGECPFGNEGAYCRNVLNTCIKRYIQQLEAERDELLQKNQRLERERDAAVEDIKKAAFCGCHVCGHYYRPDPNVRKYACRKFGDFDKVDFIADDGSIYCGAMIWRGVQGGSA